MPTRRLRSSAIAGSVLAIALLVTACNPSGGAVERDVMKRRANDAVIQTAIERWGATTAVTAKLVGTACGEPAAASEGQLLRCTVTGTVSIDGRTTRYSAPWCVYAVYRGDHANARLMGGAFRQEGDTYKKTGDRWARTGPIDYRTPLPGEAAAELTCKAPPR